MGRYHPSEPHWHLPLMGVDPLEQGKGFGSALMQLGLILCDRDNKLDHLESSSPRSIPFYERHGFELPGTIQTGTSPPIFPMHRRPPCRIQHHCICKCQAPCLSPFLEGFSEESPRACYEASDLYCFEQNL
jgi:Acetyltransferase (GNAT) domain